MGEKPKRIQRRRVKGWTKPEGAINCTRPGPYGNEFKVGMWFKKIRSDWRVWSKGDPPHFGNEQVRDLDHSLELWNDYAEHRIIWQPDWLEPLRNHDLMCWCALTSKCHVDSLLRLANR